MIAPQTGTSAYFGKTVANGIVLALKSHSDIIQYRVYDDNSSPSLASNLVDQATDWGASAIIGPLDSDVTAAAATEAQRLRVPLISPCATASYLTDSDNAWFFRANTPDRQRSDELAAWAIELIGRKGVLIVNETRTDKDRTEGRRPLVGEALANDLLIALNAEDEPASAVTYNRGSFGTDTQQAIRDRIKAGVVGAVAVLGLDKEAVPITEFVKNQAPNTPVFVIISALDLFSQSRVKSGVYAITPTVIEATRARVLDEFRRRYVLEFPGQPTPTQQCAAYGYDAAEIVASAIAKVRQDAHGQAPAPFRAALRAAIAATPNDRQGIMSVGGFTAHRELNFRPHRLVLYEGQWLEDGAVPPQTDLSPGKLAMYFGVLLSFLGSLVGLLVWQMPKLYRFGDRTVIFVISAVVGLVAALVTFGALRSYGQVSGQSLGIAFEFGGPAALFVLVLVLGSRPQRRELKSFSVTVIFHEAANNRSLLAVNGTVTLLLPRGAEKTDIKEGQAVFQALSADCRNTSVDFHVSVANYARLVDAPQLKLTPDAVLYVRLRRDTTGALPGSSPRRAPQAESPSSM